MFMKETAQTTKQQVKFRTAATFNTFNKTLRCYSQDMLLSVLPLGVSVRMVPISHSEVTRAALVEAGIGRSQRVVGWVRKRAA